MDSWRCAIRQWFNGWESQSDIDVFGQSQEALDKFIETYLLKAKLLNEHKYAKTYLLNNQLIQIIHVRFYASVLDLLDSFDFTVCQFAWDGQTIFSTPNAVISTSRKHLGAHKIYPKHAADSLRRAFKYHKKGYQLCNGTMMALAKSFVGLSEEDVQNQVEISPKGGKFIKRID